MDSDNILDRATIHYILETVHEFIVAQEWYGPNAENLYEQIPLIERIYSELREIKELRERPIV